MGSQGPWVINDTNKVSQGSVAAAAESLFVPIYINSIHNDLETLKLVPHNFN